MTDTLACIERGGPATAVDRAWLSATCGERRRPAASGRPLGRAGADPPAPARLRASWHDGGGLGGQLGQGPVAVDPLAQVALDDAARRRSAGPRR